MNYIAVILLQDGEKDLRVIYVDDGGEWEAGMDLLEKFICIDPLKYVGAELDRVVPLTGWAE